MKGSDFKILRTKRGMTLREVEKETGLSNAYLSQLENGKIKKPSYDTVEKLKALYDRVKELSEVLLCPNCKSENVEDVSVKNSNGVFGPGFSSWIVFEAMCCNKCGSLFRKLNVDKQIKQNPFG